MILVRSPLRITLGGGGTDLPAYYTKHGGMFFTAAIDKYVYVSVLKPFKKGIYVKHSGASEECAQIADIQHPLIREALRMCMPPDWVPQIEITTLADVPAGTGLGSSSACACALIAALHTFFGTPGTSDAALVADLACELEMDILGEPIGKQDAYASAFGGMRAFEIATDGTVFVKPGIDWRIQEKLEQRLQLYFTGYSRSASAILKPLQTGMFRDNLDLITVLGQEMLYALQHGVLWDIGPIMTQQWRRKTERSPEASNGHIDGLYNRGMNAGARGGKLVGAGGGGFLLFYTTEPEQLRTAMAGQAEELPFRFEDEGTMVVCQ